MPTSEIKKLNTHTIHTVVSNTPNVNTVSALSLNGEVDPIFRNSVAYTITQQDVDNWNAGAGVDLSAYVTKEQLVNQSYITINDVTYPDYSNTYQAKGEYITPTQLVNQSYITINDVTYPDYSNTYQAVGDYVTASDLSQQSYLTSETDPVFSASVAANITQQDVDNWNTGASVDLSSYVSKQELSELSYVTASDLSQQSYLTSETDPIFSQSPAASITDTDISNWNAAAGTIDMSAYVTKNELVNQSYITINDVTFPDYSNTYQAKGNYVTTTDLSQQSYLTSESDPVFSASVAANITQQDVDNWNAATGGVDLSAYVTKEQLVNQSYITINDVTYPDYSNTYQAKGEYITPAQLSAQSYIKITDVVFPDYSNTYQAKGNYVTTADLSQQSYLTSETDPVFSASPAATITAQDITNWNAGAGIDLSSYVTKTELSNQSYVTSAALDGMSYITQSDIEFPDYSSTYQTVGDYVTKSQLSDQSYVQFSTYTEDYKNIIYDGSVSILSMMDQNTYTGESISVAASIHAQDFNNVCSAGIQSHISYNGTSYDVGTIFSANITPGFNGTSRVRLSGDYVELITGEVLTIWDADNYNYKCDISFDPFVGTLQLLPANGISINYKGTGSFIASYDYILDKMNDFVVSQSYIKSESDPIFSASPAATITTQDIQNWNNGSGIDLSSYVTKTDLVNQSYIKITDVVFPDYSSTYQAAGDYITATQLVNQSYITINDVTYPDYSNTYQAKGEYITPTQLVNQSYITINDVVFPDYSNTYQSKGDYVTKAQMSAQSYITPAAIGEMGYTSVKIVTQAEYEDKQDGILYIISDAEPIGGNVDLSSYVTYDYLSAQSYLTSVTFPDYSNTYQTKGDYVTKTQMSTQSYITPATLSAQAYLTSVTFPDYSNTYQAKGEYITPTQLVNQSYIKITDVVFPDYSNTYQAKGDYVTKTDMSAQSYITPATLSAQAYLTSVTFPDYSSTYQTIGDYVTKQQLSDQSYLTSVTFPDYSNTYQAKGEYITPTQLVNQSYITINDVTYPDYSNTYQAKGEYITPAQLSAQSYIKITDVVFPDYSNTYQAKGDYVTKTEMSAQSYINATYLTTNRYLMSSYPFTGATKLYTDGMDIYNGNVFPKRLTYAEVNSSTYYDSFVSLQTMKYYVGDFMNNVVGNIETLLSNI